ncbi:Cell division control protein 6-like protein [Armadillidium nasatum]|uniref:Cell division control protein n=1 Tax=Armadillidium nasatum TaxID=96803 RepID=A0A5N5T4S8_9CRUS|nr:Cell division control protein 6-like protein [Armadillidium nasatum]
MLIKCNTKENSPENLKNYNVTPNKNKESNPLMCSIPLNFDSPRRSPRKLNFANSPSHLINKLSFTSPKKSSAVIGLHSVELSIYQSLKASLTQNCDTHIIGREAETSILKNFIGSHLQTAQPGSLYISGAPGTGKTALVTRIMKTVIIHFFIEVLLAILRIIVLDEVDQLESKDQTVLYTLFEWPALANSKLILIGIANMLDLTDRILPRLQSVKACKPQLLHFAPYSRAEIVNIINQRIKEAGADTLQVIKPSAVQFLAGKVAAVAGDARKALDVCRRAVELCEIETRKQLRLTSRSPSKSPRKGSNHALKQIDIPQILSIFNEVYGNRVTTTITENSQSLPLQQKVLICTLLLMLKHSKTKNINLGKFHEVYSRVCIRQKLQSVEQSEFFSLCSLLESRGILQVKKTKEIRNSKILLRLDEEETVEVLGDKDLLANVLEDRVSLKLKTSKD